MEGLQIGVDATRQYRVGAHIDCGRDVGQGAGKHHGGDIVLTGIRIGLADGRASHGNTGLGCGNHGDVTASGELCAGLDVHFGRARHARKTRAQIGHG